MKGHGPGQPEAKPGMEPELPNSRGHIMTPALRCLSPLALPLDPNLMLPNIFSSNLSTNSTVIFIMPITLVSDFL